MEYRPTSQKSLEVATSHPVEFVRADASDYFQGFAVVFYNGKPDTQYKMLPNLYERVERNAFDDVLEQVGRNEIDVEALYNHDPNHLLATTKTQTLYLELIERNGKYGLGYTIPYDDHDVDHKKVRSKISKGFAQGSSFKAGGRVSIKREGNNFIRYITNVDSFAEISIVNRPAYKGAEANLMLVRSELDKYQKQLERIERAKNLK